MKEPYNKKKIIKKINKDGIEDILCNTQRSDNGIICFDLEIRTKNGDSYHFNQEVSVVPHFNSMDVIYFDETGNGKSTIDLGKGFDPKTYPYKKEKALNDQEKNSNGSEE